jgi:hypothetical protein
MEKEKDGILSSLKPVHWAHDALDITDETKVIAAASSEGAKRNKTETSNSQLSANDMANSITFEDTVLVGNTTKCDEKAPQPKYMTQGILVRFLTSTTCLHALIFLHQI